jgi:hypothetical protein
MADTRHVIDRLYSALNTHDIDRALTAMRPDVDWPNLADGSHLRGREAVRDHWLRQWELADPHVDPVRVARDNMGHTVVTVHQVMRSKSGVVLKDELVQHVYDMEDGLILAMEVRRL